MGYLASLSGFIVVDPDTGRILSDKVYTSHGHAERRITAGAYAVNRKVVELNQDTILAILKEAE